MSYNSMFFFWGKPVSFDLPFPPFVFFMRILYKKEMVYKEPLVPDSSLFVPGSLRKICIFIVWSLSLHVQ